MLCKQQNAALRRGLHAYTVGFSVQHLRRREIPLLPHLPSALRTAMEGGREEAGLMACPAGSTVRGMRTFSRHELIT